MVRRRVAAAITALAASFALLPAVAAQAAPAPAEPSAPRTQSWFATPDNTGTPQGWKPRRTVEGDLVVRRAGARVRDVRVLGNLIVAAPDVTLHRVEVVGGSIDNWSGSTCHPGLVLRRTTVRTAEGQVTSGDDPAVTAGGYRAIRTKIDGLPEGFRVGGADECGPVTIRRSYARVVAPTVCGDWHGDALQGYDGARLVIRESRFDLVERPDCGGTAPFFYPSEQGNSAVDIDGLVVSGGGYSFRLGTPGSVRGLMVVRGSYHYGPLEVACSRLSAWEATSVRLDASGKPVAQRPLRCTTNQG